MPNQQKLEPVKEPAFLQQLRTYLLPVIVYAIDDDTGTTNFFIRAQLAGGAMLVLRPERSSERAFKSLATVHRYLVSRANVTRYTVQRVLPPFKRS